MLLIHIYINIYIIFNCYPDQKNLVESAKIQARTFQKYFVRTTKNSKKFLSTIFVF